MQIEQDAELLDELRAIAMSPGRAWRSLPPAAFFSTTLYDLEVEHVFRRRWILVGRADQVSEVGDYFCFDALGEPMVVVRGHDNKVRVLSRVCRHRWMHVCEGAGSTQAFVCPYHAWTYEIDGELRYAPEMSKTPNFNPSDVKLPQIRSEVWEGFVFVNLSGDAPPVSNALASARQQLAEFDLSNWVTVRSIDLGDCPWDWKVFMDNGEIYHHMMLHRETVEPRSPARLSVAGQNNGEFFLLYGPAAASVLTRAQDGEPMMPSYLRALGNWSPSRLTQQQRTSAVFFYPYPNHAIVLLVNIGIFFRVVPLAPGRCTVKADYIVPREFAEHPELEAAIDQAVRQLKVVIEEDAVACEAVQRGVRSRFATRGSLSRIEDHNDAFARWLARTVTG